MTIPRVLPLLIVATLVAASPPRGAVAAEPELAATCGAQSSYDLLIEDDWLHFERARPLPARVSVGAGRLQLDGTAVDTRLEDRDRLVLFEQVLRDLLPEVRQLARQAVDLALEEVRGEALELAGGRLSPQAEARLAARRAEIHARINASNSTRDWQGEVFESYIRGVTAELLPLLGADVARRALDLAMAGDLAAAAALRQRAERLPQTMPGRIQDRLEQLRPRAERLCPRVRELAQLSNGVSAAGAGGQGLGLVEIRD